MVVYSYHYYFPHLGLFQNMTIEERVSLLEIQVGELEEDVMDFDVDLIELEGDVDFLFDETVIQDERLFALEQITVAITADLVAVDDELDLIDDEFDTINNELESKFETIILPCRKYRYIIYHVCIHYCAFSRCPNFNHCLGFPSNNFGREWRGWWEQLCD